MFSTLSSRIGWLRSLDQKAIELIDPTAHRSQRLLIFACALLAAMAAYAGLIGVDARMFMNSDTLYPIQLQDFSWLSYRPPPSNNLFPDVIVHALVDGWFADPFTEKLFVGVAIFVATCVLVTGLQGPFGLIAFLTAYSVCGFYFLDSTAHFSLPLCLLIWLLTPAGIVRNLLLFFAVFSDVLFLIPFFVARLTRMDADHNAPTQKSGQRLEWWLIALAVVLNVVYAEFSSGIAKLLPLLAGFAAFLIIADRLKVLNFATLCVVILLLAGTAIGLPSRYSAPISACLLMLMLVSRRPLVWRMRSAYWLAVPILMLVIFSAGLNTTTMRHTQQRFSCLSDVLKARGISVVAADHWTSKPLYFAGYQGFDEAGNQLTITQIDFEEGDLHMWMGPHVLYGKPTEWAIHNRYACNRFTNEAKYCGQHELGNINTVEPVCEVFDLVRYADAIPSRYPDRPVGKLASARFQLVSYLGKVRRLISR